jgi:tetratricopeptide (TPR) repeat protein
LGLLALTISLTVISVTPSQSPGQREACPAASSAALTQTRRAAAEEAKAGHAAEALRLLKKAEALCPEDYNNSFDLVQAQIANGDDEDAERLVKTLLLHSDTAELHFLLGFAKERPRCGRAISSRGQDEPHRKECFCTRDYADEAQLPCCNGGAPIRIKKYPASVKMHVALALALYALDRSEEGAQLLCEAADLDPSDAHPMEVLADTGVVPLSIRPQAERHLAELHRRYPNDGLILLDRAMVQSGCWSGEKTTWSAELVGQLKASLKLDPQLSEAFFELAVSYGEDKDVSDKIAALKSAVVINPKIEKYHFRLAFAYREAGDTADFKQELPICQELHKQAASLQTE